MQNIKNLTSCFKNIKTRVGEKANKLFIIIKKLNRNSPCKSCRQFAISKKEFL